MSKVADVYDRIAEDYRDSKLLGFREAIEAETLRRLQGDLSGLQVIDLACGDGHYTRRLRSDGASGVIGVDVSPEMIKLAEEAERENPMGCRYAVADVADFSSDEPADLVVAMYLLNYAETPEQLAAFIDAAAGMLKPGGRFIGFNDNPNSDPARHGSMNAYGFERRVDRAREEGDAIHYTMQTPDGAEFEFDNYYLSDATYRTAFNQAGFTGFSWEGPFLTSSEHANSHWTHFMNHAPVIGFSATKL